MKYATRFTKDLGQIQRYSNLNTDLIYEENPDGEFTVVTIPRTTFKVENDGYTIYYTYPSNKSHGNHLMRLAVVHPDDTSIIYEYDKLDRLFHIRYSSGVNTYTIYLCNKTSSIIAAKLICYERNVVQTIINQDLDRKSLEFVSKSNLVGKFIRRNELNYTAATNPAIRAKLENAEW